jgi:hypothetical protein
MKTYNKLSEMPEAIHETGYTTFYPKQLALEILEYMQDSEWYIAHCDQSKNTVENIKSIIETLSGNRIKFV